MTLCLASISSNLLIKSSLTYLWGLINNLQLITIISVIAVPIPNAIVYSFIEVILKLSQVDVLPVVDWMQEKHWITFDEYRD
jgi:hypothetical protein